MTKIYHIQITASLTYVWFRFMVSNATFNIVSAILWQSVLLVEETRVHEENHQLIMSHCQTLSLVTVKLYQKSLSNFITSHCQTLSQVTVKLYQKSLSNFITSHCQTLSQVTVKLYHKSLSNFITSHCQTLSHNVVLSTPHQ